MSIEESVKDSDREARLALLKAITAKANQYDALTPSQVKDLAEAYAWTRYPNQPH